MNNTNAPKRILRSLPLPTISPRTPTQACDITDIYRPHNDDVMQKCKHWGHSFAFRWSSLRNVDPRENKFKLRSRVNDPTHYRDVKGRAIAQAVSRRLPTAAARVQTRVFSCGILWWIKVALGQVFSEYFGFPCQSPFHLLLHNRLHNHPRLVQ
jgi:hypothetical protein